MKKLYPQLIANKSRCESPCIVLLGAGASLAAFPNGDKNGRKLPLMRDFILTLGLEHLITQADLNPQENFEVLYSKIFSDEKFANLRNELEKSIYIYFSKMRIPEQVTLYDKLLLSLRGKDVIATFNWDPFLAQAFVRNKDIAEMPKILFLHGNVEIGCCNDHKTKGWKSLSCNTCGKHLEPSKLLYPITNKNYSKDPFIAAEWKELKFFLQNGYELYIFGYSAPVSDIDAKNLLLDGWNKNQSTDFTVIEIIDLKEEEELKKTWSDFPTWSFGNTRDIEKTYLFNHPRRSCDALAMATLQQAPWPDNHFPEFEKLTDLHDWIKPLVDEEKLSDSLSSKGVAN